MATEWQTWRNQIPTEIEKGTPEAQKPSTFGTPPRRGRGAGRGRARSRRAPKARSSDSSTSELLPIPYRRIQDDQGKPIFRDADHSREGLAGMIGVTKEEWDQGLRTPLYAPPSDWMRLRVLQMESEMARRHFWVEEIDGDGARRAEEVELGRRVHEDIMNVGWVAFNARWKREELMGVPIPDEPVPRKKRVEGVAGESSDGTGSWTDYYAEEEGKVLLEPSDPSTTEDEATVSVTCGSDESSSGPSGGTEDEPSSGPSGGTEYESGESERSRRSFHPEDYAQLYIIPLPIQQ
ncbi:hypothetical protein VE04_10210 [Pseudogymnoascus sp. 24MN13]|nr:hypothetical protein VE04_10210 [Pseudogymnoascus sp. 24MN13]